LTTTTTSDGAGMRRKTQLPAPLGLPVGSVRGEARRHTGVPLRLSGIDTLTCLWVDPRSAVPSPGVWIVFVERGIADAGVGQQQVLILRDDRTREESVEVADEFVCL
jgi:hypothetical protein